VAIDPVDLTDDAIPTNALRAITARFDKETNRVLARTVNVPTVKAILETSSAGVYDRDPLSSANSAETCKKACKTGSFCHSPSSPM